jgi:hypothetical protein
MGKWDSVLRQEAGSVLTPGKNRDGSRKTTEIQRIA